MQKYKKSIKLGATDVDINRCWKTSSIFEIMEDCAISHTEILGAGRSKTLDRGLLWVLTNVSLKMNKYPEYEDEVNVYSWPGNTLHVIFPRFYSFEGIDGTVYGTATSSWVLIDMKTRKIIFPSQYDISIPSDDNSFILPHDIKEIKGHRTINTKRVLYSDCDLNHHMTNSKYIELICNNALLSTDKTIKSLDISFVSEALFGSEFQVVTTEHKDEFSVFGYNDEKIIFKSIVKTF